MGKSAGSSGRRCINRHVVNIQDRPDQQLRSGEWEIPMTAPLAEVLLRLECETPPVVLCVSSTCGAPAR